MQQLTHDQSFKSKTFSPFESYGGRSWTLAEFYMGKYSFSLGYPRGRYLLEGGRWVSDQGVD